MKLFHTPHSVAVTVECIQFLHDHLQELPFLFWKITVASHGNTSVDRKRLFLWKIEINHSDSNCWKLPVAVINTNIKSHTVVVSLFCHCKKNVRDLDGHPRGFTLVLEELLVIRLVYR